MVIDLKLCRFENASWGFRLTGGADFDFPLTVVKVTEGSLAEQAGMKVGDIIVRINDDTASTMTHNDAHKIITHCGNTFFLGILRESDEQNVPNTEIITHENLYTPDSAIRCISKSPMSDVSSEKKTSIISENNDPSLKEHVTEEEKVTDDEIAEMMSGEAEVLKEHNIIGVNFNRIFPKAGICQSSEVFRTLNDEAIKTKTELEKDKRKWTTFLQRPDRPIPKSKQELEEEAKHVPYKVQIVKQPKPKVAPDHIPTPPPEPTVEAVLEPQETQSPKLEDVNEVTELPTDSEVPDLELIEEDTETDTIQCYKENQMDSELNNEQLEKKDDNNNSFEDNGKLMDEPIVQKTEEELLLERQLADVQKQLMALSTLPSTIQATLDAVTKQLAELLPNFRLQPSPNPETVPKDSLPEENYIQNDEDIVKELENECEAENDVEPEQDEDYKKAEDKVEEEPSQPVEPTPEEIQLQKLQAEQLQIEEELNYKKQKEQERLEEDHRQRLIRERMPKRPPKAFGPLTPQERPLILPGGRRWRTPKDAFNEEFIAEVLSSQAELIVGTTLGVNFLKYQKPEKRIDLEKSEVYKVVHHLERQPRRGIEVRPAKVLSEGDVRSCATPISCG